MFEKDIERLQCLRTRREYIERIYSGDTLSEACAMMRLNPAALAMARREDMTFDADIRAAQAFRVDVMVDKLENISEYESDPAMAATVSRNIQWLASKRMREIYGDRVDVHKHVTIDIKAAMVDARARVVLDHQPNLLINNAAATDSTSVAQAPDIIEQDEIDPLS